MNALKVKINKIWNKKSIDNHNLSLSPCQWTQSGWKYARDNTNYSNMKERQYNSIQSNDLLNTNAIDPTHHISRYQGIIREKGIFIKIWNCFIFL